MKKLCVIGAPVEHSLYPRIQQCLMEMAGLDYSYDGYEILDHELADFVRSAKDGAWAGFNVTSPHKRAIMPLLDEISEEARRVGAVNTVVIREGRAIGYNNDSLGFLKSLQHIGFDPKDKTVLLIGGGASGEAILSALVRSGVGKVTVCNRSVYRAMELSERYGEKVEWMYFGTWPLRRAASQCDMIINATNLGTINGKEFSDLGFLSDANPQAIVYDLVYSPHDTLLLRQAEKQGLKTVGGIEMVIPQAIEGFRDFTGVYIDADKAYRAIGEIFAEE